MAEAAIDLSRLASNDMAGVAPSPPAWPFDVIDPAAWAGVTPPWRAWAWDKLAPHAHVTLLAGRGAVGKSLLAQQLATHVALGLPFMGHDVRQARALYLTCEDEPDELHRRQAAIMRALGRSEGELADKLTLASLWGRIGNALAIEGDGGTIIATTLFHELEDAVKRAGVGFVVLDNVAHLFAGNENDRGHATAFLSICERLAKAIDGAVILLAHTPKAGDAGYSGSTAWENAVRARLLLDYPDAGEGGLVDPDARVLTLGKANQSQRGEAIAMHWRDHQFTHDDDLPADAAAEIAANVAANADNALFLACLDELTRQQRAVSERPSPSFAPTVFARLPQSRRIGRPRLISAMDRLFQIGVIERGELPWRSKDRKAIEGLRRVDGVRATVRETPRETVAANAGDGIATPQDSVRETRPTNTLYTTYIPGGALDGPPPVTVEGVEP